MPLFRNTVAFTVEKSFINQEKADAYFSNVRGVELIGRLGFEAYLTHSPEVKIHDIMVGRPQTVDQTEPDSVDLKSIRYYTQACFSLPTTPEQTEWALKLLSQCRLWLSEREKTNEDPAHGLFDDALEGHVESLVSDYETNTISLNTQYIDNLLHIWEDRKFNPIFVAEWLQIILRHFTILDTWWFGWSYSCSHPIPDGYGGGGCVVNKDVIRYVDINDWCVQTVINLKSTRQKGSVRRF